MICVKGAKVITVLPEEKKKEWKKKKVTSASEKSLIDGKFYNFNLNLNG